MFMNPSLPVEVPLLVMHSTPATDCDAFLSHENITSAASRAIEINRKLSAMNKLPLLTPLRLAALCCYECDADTAGGWKPPPATPENTTFIWDTGASIGLTLFLSDFINCQKLENTKVRDIAWENNVLGVGMVIWKLKSTNGRDVVIPAVAYHMDTCDVRLFSPQAYFNLHGGHAYVDDKHVMMNLPDGNRVQIAVDPHSNLPQLSSAHTTQAERNEIGPHFMSAYIGARNKLQLHWIAGAALRRATSRSVEHVSNDTNRNLSGPQKELLLWHWKLCVNMRHVQELMRSWLYQLPDRDEVALPPIILTRHPTTRSCSIPLCLSCKFATLKTRTPKVRLYTPVEESEGVLKSNKYEPGDMVSSDQFDVAVPGHMLKGFGQNDMGYNGGTMYVNSASNYVHVEHQTSMGAGETVLGKERFEQSMWNLAGVTVKHYHSDNGIYNISEGFRDSCREHGQTQSFSGVGAKHQNAIAERNIQTICYWARTLMVHAALHWETDGAANIRLWPFAVQHAVWLYNHIPNCISGLSPLEILTKTKSDHRELLGTHVWGCPVFVPDPCIQDGKKIPKWNCRSRMGQFVGFSKEHSSLVANVSHSTTGHVSTQYHVVFNDLFHTVPRSDTPSATTDAIVDTLFETSRETFADIERNADGSIIYSPPPLDDVWLTEAERRESHQAREKLRAHERDQWMQDMEAEPPMPPLPTTTPRSNRPSGNGNLIPDDDDSNSESEIDYSGGGGNMVSDDEDDSPPVCSVENPRAERKRIRRNEGAITGPTNAPVNEPTGVQRSRRSRRETKDRLMHDGNWEATMKFSEFSSSILSRRAVHQHQFACTFGSKQPPPL